MQSYIHSVVLHLPHMWKVIRGFECFIKEKNENDNFSLFFVFLYFFFGGDGGESWGEIDNYVHIFFFDALFKTKYQALRIQAYLSFF